MLGYLLARAGVSVVVIEKHGDFLRDFRGDTVHPSTIELMHELGILDEFLALPHQKVFELGAQIGDDHLQMADFSRLRTQANFVAFMPQWDFLNFLVSKARQYAQFSLLMDTEATGLIENDGQVEGVIADTEDGELRINADLIVGADGRTSIVRNAAGLEVKDVGAPMDILWMRMTRKKTDPPQTLGRINYGVFLIMLNREDYWQCGLVIPKGKLDDYKQQGLEAFRTRITRVAPFMADRVHELKSWDDIKLLTVKVDRLKKWYREGLLCIGDAAHAMSPVGGVGINLAIQDAVATANILYKPLLDRRCTVEELEKVQLRRLYPARMTQRVQVAIQNNVVRPIFKSEGIASLPWLMKGFNKLPALRLLPAAIIGIGFRAEHVQTPDVGKVHQISKSSVDELQK